MAGILQQLRSRGLLVPLTASTDECPWTFSQEISQKNTEFFESLAHERPLLAAQYRVQCAQLISMFEADSTTKDSFFRAAESALVLAVLLEHIYHRFEETDDLIRLRADQARLGQLLSRSSQIVTLKSTESPSTSSTSQWIRRLVDRTTQPRLLLVRIRRTILAAIELNELAVCRPWVSAVERVTNPFFLNLSWLFFIPRLTLNMMFLCKHVLPHPWMSNEERALSWTRRLQTYLSMHRHSFELANDLGWFLCGVLSCFLCTGAWLPVRVYLAIAMQVGEFVISYLRSRTEISLLRTLEEEYNTGLSNGSLIEEPDYRAALRSRMEHESRVYTLELTRNALLTISSLTILPVFLAISHFIPIFGAVLAVATSIVVIVWTDLNVKQRPADDLAMSFTEKKVSAFLTKNGFFRPEEFELPETKLTLFKPVNGLVA